MQDSAAAGGSSGPAAGAVQFVQLAQNVRSIVRSQLTERLCVAGDTNYCSSSGLRAERRVRRAAAAGSVGSCTAFAVRVAVLAQRRSGAAGDARLRVVARVLPAAALPISICEQRTAIEH